MNISYYRVSQPNLIDSPFKKKVYYIMSREPKNHWIIEFIKNIFNDYIKDNLLLIIILTILGLFLYKRYKEKRKEDEDKVKKELGLDDDKDKKESFDVKLSNVGNKRGLMKQMFPRNTKLPMPTTYFEVAPLSMTSFTLPYNVDYPINQPTLLRINQTENPNLYPKISRYNNAYSFETPFAI